MSMADRPARPARGKLTPPANNDVDPIDARPATPAPQPSRPTSTRENTPAEGKGASVPAASPSVPPRTASPTLAAAPAPNATVQSGVSWSPETEQLVREAKARTGKTRRAIVEEAIVRVWGASSTS